MTAAVGTLQYMAPELLPMTVSLGRLAPEDGALYDESVDTYAVGMLLWALATRRDPLGAYDWTAAQPIQGQIARSVVGGERPQWPEDTCPDWWRDLAEHCWRAHPEQRPPMAAVRDEIGRPHRISFLAWQ